MSDDFSAIRIARAWDEGPRLRAMELDLGGTDFAGRHVAPGQYVRARLPGMKETFLALATPPGAPFELLLQRSPSGGPAHTVDALAALEVGAAFEMSAPGGKGFPIAGETGRDVLLFAGGSGISAIRSLVEWIGARRADFGRTVLLFGARTEEDLAYRSLFGRWGRQRIEVVPVLSRASPGSWTGRAGHVQDALPDLAVDPARTSAFVTGGKGFDEAVTLALGRLGVTRVFRNF